ncbi:hypothetical protein VIBNISOn1_p0025 [Vibrio nigripulchritudo SOn1]|uniref:Methyl-accepting transducer domain-containing protein n=1 Tax=Vibrio nigripulchritudo SOn1 TaxID=1238450 RepID=A0AAV2W1E5_9VIBR|nr:methyl-accepting chemotaxis protein [Vibrio nigripulchritudo]CCO50188.1 hypothetical protein VIBNISOn1_p0025 [Vibrio nigripulchritudo SOn1]
MFNKVPLLYRFLIPILSSVILGIAVLSFTMISTVNKNYREAVLIAAGDSLAKNAAEIQGQVNESIQVTQALARSLSSLTADHENFNENAIMNLLYNTQQNNFGLFYGVWANWLPNKYPDTVSNAYISEGHFAPMAFPSSDGGISKVTTTGHSGNDEKSLWFIEPVTTGKLYMTEPTSYFIDGRDVNLITIGFPIYHKGNIVGVAGVNMNAGAIQENTGKLNYKGIGYAFLVTNAQKYFSHPNADFIGEIATTDFPTITQVRSSMVETAYSAVDKQLGKMSQTILYPLEFKNSRDVMTLGIVLPEEELFAFLDTLSLEAILIAIVLITVMAALTYLVIRQLVNKIGGEPDHVIHQVIAMTQGDLSHKSKPKKSREDSLIAYVHNLSLNLSKMMSEFAVNSKSLSESATFLKNASQDLVKNTIEQSNGSTQVADAAMDMTQTIHSIANNLKDMADYAEETGCQTKESSIVVKASVDSIYAIKSTAEKSNESVTALQSSAEKILNIVNVIADIAEQTNLLALNAAIEAARAGDNGRGFAVVADEVRGLASRTQTATLEISDLVNATQRDVEGVSSSMKHVSDQVASGVQQSEKVEESLRLIAQRIDSLEERLCSVSAETTEIANASEEVKSNIDHVASSADSVNNVASHVLEQADGLDQMSGSIRKLVERFKL